MAIDVITFQIDVGHLEDELVHQQMVLGTFKFCECGVVLQCCPAKQNSSFVKRSCCFNVNNFAALPIKLVDILLPSFFLNDWNFCGNFFNWQSACKVLPINLGWKIRLFGCDAAYLITGLHLYMSVWLVKTLSGRNLCISFWGYRRESPVSFPSSWPVSIQSWRIMA